MAGSKLTFSLASNKKKKPKEQPSAAASEFQNDDDQKKKRGVVERTEPLVIPLPDSAKLTLLERKRQEKVEEAKVKTDDEIAAEALIKSAMNRDSMTAADNGGATNFSASGDIVISSGQNTNLVKAHAAASSDKDKDKQQYENDLTELPEEADADAYERVPIAEFGAALLRGMGWKGESTGGKATAAPAMRPHRLGLGATPKLPPTSSRPGKMRTANQVKKDEQMQKQQAGFEKQRQERLAQDKQQTLQLGSIVYCGRGPDRAKVLKLQGVPGLNRVMVQFEGERKGTSVKKGDLSLVGRQDLSERQWKQVELEEERTETKFMGVKQERRNTGDDRDRRGDERDGGDRRRKRRHEDDNRRSYSRPDEKRKRRDVDPRDDGWMIRNIRVRLVSKKLGSRQYKEKGVVIDVTRRGEATIQMADGQMLDRVPERYLETALPKAGGNAIVLVGKSKFAKGKLLERDSRSGKGVIQVFEDMSVLKLSLDDMAEWVGPLDDDMME